MLNEAIGSAIVGATAATRALSVNIRGTMIPLQLIKPPFIELKKST
jgi:aminomethyltransferase